MSIDSGSTDCVMWTGHIARNGYGHIGVRLAHRVAYEKANGPIPDGLHIDHLCGNRACVNPDHLEAVTQAENNRRAWARRDLQVECSNGHVGRYWVSPTTGKRQCRECLNERQRRYRARSAA